MVSGESLLSYCVGSNTSSGVTEVRLWLQAVTEYGGFEEVSKTRRWTQLTKEVRA